MRFVYQDWNLPPLEPAMVNSAVIMKHYRQLSLRYGYTILPNEVNINDWAAYLMKNAETLDNAISLFEMNTKNFPASYKAFSSLGDAYVKKREKRKAIACYRKAIELNPAATIINDKLKSL